MIADLDETLRQLLIADIPIKNGEIAIAFDQPKREWSARLSKPTVNLFLYDTRENYALRKHQFERMHQKQNGRKVTEKRTPLRLELTYMLSTWAAEPQDEHRLMGRVVRALFRYPSLPVDRLHGKLKRQPYRIPAQLAKHDKLTNPAELWSALDNEMRPTVSYIVTLAIDPWEEVTGPAVLNLTMRTHYKEGLTNNSTQIDEVVSFGGVVRDSAENPLHNVEIKHKISHITTVTNQHGQYRFTALPPGSHTFIIQPPSGEPQELTFTLPNEDNNYDVELAL